MHAIRARLSRVIHALAGHSTVVRRCSRGESKGAAHQQSMPRSRMCPFCGMLCSKACKHCLLHGLARWCALSAACSVAKRIRRTREKRRQVPASKRELTVTPTEGFAALRSAHSTVLIHDVDVLLIFAVALHNCIDGSSPQLAEGPCSKSNPLSDGIGTCFDPRT